MLSIKKTPSAREFAVILDTKTHKVAEVLYLIERDSYKLVEDPNVRKTLEKYGELTFSNENDEDLTNSITLKEGYYLFPVPSSFKKEGSNQRCSVAVTGKAGSGKSYFVAQYVNAYHHMYPKNLIRYVSLNRIATDPSYKPLLEKKSFQKVLLEIDPRKINSSVNSSSFSNTLFIFDDIMDVEIPVDPKIIQADYRKEKEQTYFAKEKAKLRTREERRREKEGNRYVPLTAQQQQARIPPIDPAVLEATLLDRAITTRLNKARSDYIHGCIHASIEDILKRGRKYGVSIITTTHKLFDRNPTADTANDESGLVVLFPYANVSNEKLVEFLREKLSFDRKQARAVVSRVFKNYEFLAINTTGRKFFLTSNHLEFL